MDAEHAGGRPRRARAAKRKASESLDDEELERSRKRARVSASLACPFEGCSHRCKYPSVMEIHCRTHTNEKPFRCPAPGCTHKCTQKTNLKTHYTMHHPELWLSELELDARIEEIKVPTPLAFEMAQKALDACPGGRSTMNSVPSSPSRLRNSGPALAPPSSVFAAAEAVMRLVSRSDGEDDGDVGVSRSQASHGFASRPSSAAVRVIAPKPVPVAALRVENAQTPVPLVTVASPVCPLPLRSAFSALKKIEALDGIEPVQARGTPKLSSSPVMRKRIKPRFTGELALSSLAAAAL
eukprot:Amastigsp_a843944_148.p1 type:complete len:296 gc:universal Amastigsp_a843944_148:944-57(-)